MKIIFHGAAREVGKSCIELVTNNRRYLFDAGIKFIHKGNEYPKALDKIFDLDGIFLSHAHLDHSGALPMLEHKNLNCPIYLTHLTWIITNMLLEDSYHLEKLKHLHPAYCERDINRIKKDLRFIRYDQVYETRDKKIKFRFLNAGHIPGSASILLEVEGKKLLYTGDINTEETNLMFPSELEYLDEEIDVLITENTYGDRLHPDREESEKALLKSINTCLDNGGSVLLPVFSVGRSQEILMLLNNLERENTIYLDGMPRKLTEKILNADDEAIANRDILRRMFKRVKLIRNPKERPIVGNKKGVIILTSSGMVQGGPVVSYMEHFVNKKENFVILTGYQAKGTNGRSIFEDHLFYKDHRRFNVKCHVRKFDFSAHYGQDRIHRLVEKLNPKHLILQHGDLEAIEAVYNWVENNPKISSKVYMPSIGDKYEF